MNIRNKCVARRILMTLTGTTFIGASLVLSKDAISQSALREARSPAAKVVLPSTDSLDGSSPCSLRCGDRMRVGGLRTVFRFDRNSGRFPEGIAISRSGSIYLAVQPTGEIVRLGSRGQVTTVADLDESGGFMLGIAMDPDENIYAALASFDSLTHGVWRITRGGNAKLVAAMPTSSLPNAIAFDPDGNLYVTDTFGGAVWKLSKSGEFSSWLADPLLEGTGALFGIAAGANGIAFNDEGVGALYVSNTDRGTIVRIPIRSNGTAGSPSTFARADSLVSADGLRFDVRGHLYVAVNLNGTIARVDRCGNVDIVASGLDRPAELAFGTAFSQRQVIFTTTFGLDSGEHLAKIDVGIRGLPVP